MPSYTYHYDRANRLIRADYNNTNQLNEFSVNGLGNTVKSTTGFNVTNPIAYDANGNFLSLKRNLAQPLEYAYYNHTNRLKSTDGSGKNNYSYDLAGNVIANAERNITRITYDHRNLAQQIGTENSGVHRYIYDETGSRIGKQYRQHGATSWSVNTRYIYGAYGELLAQYDGASPEYWNISAIGETIGRMDAKERRFYYLKDHLGSIRVTLNQTGTHVGYDDYYPFGLQMENRSYNDGNTHSDQKFTGHFLEQEGGLGVYHAQARMYDPVTGRFWGVDAMRVLYPNWNSYAYALNNPVLLIDTTGNCPEDGSAGPNQYGPGECLAAVTKTETRLDPLPFPELGEPATIERDGYERVGNRVRFDPSHEAGRNWLYNHLRDTGTACDAVGNASFSTQAQSIAMTACIHASQAAFMRQGSILTVLSVGTVAGVAGLVLTPAGLVMGAKGLTTAGTYFGYASIGLSTAGNAMSGKKSTEGLIVDAGIGLLSMGAGNHINTARGLSPQVRGYYNSMTGGSLWMMNKGMDIK